MSLYAFHLGQIMSTVLGQVDHDGQHGNAARTPIRDETSETDHTQKRRFRHSAIYQTIKALIGYSEVLIWFRDGGFRGGPW
jgi:hypothetical protein